MIVSYIGIPGAGKSTQIALMKQSALLGEAELISIPALLKRTESFAQYLTEEEQNAIAENRAESTKMRKCGRLAPFVLDEVVFGIVQKMDAAGKHVIMDGCPRGRKQAELLWERFTPQQRSRYVIAELYFPENEQEMSRDRQYLRTVHNSRLSIEQAIEKINKIPAKISVFIEDTRDGLAYLAAQGVPIIRENALLAPEQICADLQEKLAGQIR